jgi:hypothetical protein
VVAERQDWLTQLQEHAAASSALSDERRKKNAIVEVDDKSE